MHCSVPAIASLIAPPTKEPITYSAGIGPYGFRAEVRIKRSTNTLRCRHLEELASYIIGQNHTMPIISNDPPHGLTPLPDKDLESLRSYCSSFIGD